MRGLSCGVRQVASRGSPIRFGRGVLHSRVASAAGLVALGLGFFQRAVPASPVFGAGIGALGFGEGGGVAIHFHGGASRVVRHVFKGVRALGTLVCRAGNVGGFGFWRRGGFGRGRRGFGRCGGGSRGTAPFAPAGARTCGAGRRGQKEREQEGCEAQSRACQVVANGGATASASRAAVGKGPFASAARACASRLPGRARAAQRRLSVRGKDRPVAPRRAGAWGRPR